MMEEMLLLKGGTIVTGYDTKHADIWIDKHQIRYVTQKSPALLKKLPTTQSKSHQIIDVSGFYILPGFIAMKRDHNKMLSTSITLAQQIRSFIEKGITSFMDAITLETWQGMDRISYLLSAYQESPLDYAIRLGLSAEEFTYSHVKALRQAGFSWLEVLVHSPEQIDKMEWDRIFPLLSYHHIALALTVSQEQGMTTSLREQIMNEWEQVCRYGNIRTLIHQPSKIKIHENDYYSIRQLHGKQIEEHLGVYKQNWFAQYPVVASIEDWVEPIHTKDWTAEQFLSLVVRLASTQVAKAIGLFPRKGCIIPWADADLLLIDKSEWLTNFERSTILRISEICLPAYVMSNGSWEYLFGKHVHHNRVGGLQKLLKPYNYAI